jgi:hypothetical protein
MWHDEPTQEVAEVVGIEEVGQTLIFYLKLDMLHATRFGKLQVSPTFVQEGGDILSSVWSW